MLTPQDHVQSRGKYFPYGEERTNVSPANPPNDQEKFATYTRDSATGLDYAMQRYYSSALGRFTTPDRVEQLPLGNPQSFNRFSYAACDPTNGNDPNGTCTVYIAGITEGPGSHPGFDAQLASRGAITAFPFRGGNVLMGVTDVTIRNPRIAAVAAQALSAAASDGSIDVIVNSGGSQAFESALQSRPDLRPLIRSVTYVDPISVEVPSAPPIGRAIVGTANFSQAGLTNNLVNFPPGTPVTYDACGHSIECHAQASTSAIFEQSIGGPCTNPATFASFPPNAYPGPRLGDSPYLFGSYANSSATDFNRYFFEFAGTPQSTSVTSTISYVGGQANSEKPVSMVVRW